MEDENSSGERKEVTNARAAELLTDWRQRRLLVPFIPGPTSMSEAAKQLGMKLNAVHYRVKQLLDLDLLEVKGSAKRQGRAVKLYGLTAKEFFVPFASTPHETVEAMIRRLSVLDEFLTQAVSAHTSQDERWGVLVSADTSDKEQGKERRFNVKLTPLDSQGAPAPRPRQALLALSAPAVWSGETQMMLDFETAKDLQRELTDLIERFAKKQRAGEQRYYFVLGMAPIREA